MSRKDKQADLRRRMAEARSKLLAQSSIKGDDEEEVGVTKKRKLSNETVSQTVGGVGGILRKPKYTTKQPSVASKHNSNSSHQNATTSSIGALVDYGESSSDEDEDNVQVDKNRNRVVESSLSAAIKSNTAPSLRSSKTIEENNNQQTQMNNKKLIESSTSKQIITPKDQDKEISDEVWDEFNSILDADEAATKVTLDTSSASLTKAAASEANDYDQMLLDSKDKNNNKLDQDDSRSNNKKEAESTKSTKDDLYDNDEVNNMEQTSYEARLARLILLKNKKKKQSGLADDNDVMEEVKLPSANEFYDSTLAWAEDDEHDDDDDDDDDDKGEKQTSSQSEANEDMNSNQTTSNPAAVAAPAVSMADILRRRRDEARMIATRGNDVNGEDDISDGNWF